MIYEYRNGRCLLDEINLHYTTLSRLVASMREGTTGKGEGIAVGKLVDDDGPLTSIRWTTLLPCLLPVILETKAREGKEGKKMRLTTIVDNDRFEIDLIER